MPADGAWRVRLAGPTFPTLDLAAVAELLASGWLTNGANVQAFEQEFAAYQGAAHAVAVSSGSAALHLALLAHGIGVGDEVITSAFTFAATCNAIVHAGATPVLADIDPRTLNLAPASVEQAITPRTRAVIVVHFAGLPVDLDAILALRDRHGFALIHDAAHATEARHHGRSMAELPDTACFSFYATKNLPIGEGGMLTTHEPDIARAARALRSHGMSADAYQRADRWGHWDMQRPGLNYKMAELPALLGRGQLGHIDGWRDHRASLAARYETALAAMDGVRLSARMPHTVHAHHLFVVRIDPALAERDALVPQLRSRGIEVTVNYRPVHELSWYRDTYGWSAEDFPAASQAGRTCITLPLHPRMTAADVDLVVHTLRSLLPA